MEKKSKNIWKIGCVIFTYIVLIGIIIGLSIYISKLKSNHTSVEDEVVVEKNIDEEIFKDIRLNEDYSTDGRVENLANVRWNNARIMQNDNQMEVSIMLNNESKDAKIGKKTLTITLLDKGGKEICSKEVKINGISANYGYTYIEFTNEMKEYVIVDNIKIVANKEETENQTNEIHDKNTVNSESAEKEE